MPVVIDIWAMASLNSLEVFDLITQRRFMSSPCGHTQIRSRKKGARGEGGARLGS